MLGRSVRLATCTAAVVVTTVAVPVVVTSSRAVTTLRSRAARESSTSFAVRPDSVSAVARVTSAKLGAESVATSAGEGASCTAHSAKVHFYAGGKGKTVALTFDDGPGRDTGRIISILRHAHVPATFFNLGVNEKARPAEVRTEQRYGFVIGDHTWDHADLISLSAAGQAKEIDRERREQRKITHHDPCVFRPPSGDYDATTLQLAAARHMSTWYWSVDTEDWKADGSGASYWVNRITQRADAGVSQRHPVILMHNQPAGNPATVAALPKIIAYYKAHHYRFVVLT